jgi:regulation of enolase protein 1 (concanavalin A-like superfamily)
MQTITNTSITETLLNKPLTQAESYFKSDFDRLTKQIEINKEYYQLYIKNGIIIKILNMKER